MVLLLQNWISFSVSAKTSNIHRLIVPSLTHSELLQLNPRGSLKIPDIFTMVSKILFHPSIKKELFCGSDYVSLCVCILKHDHCKGLKSDFNCEQHAHVYKMYWILLKCMEFESCSSIWIFINDKTSFSHSISFFSPRLS